MQSFAARTPFDFPGLQQSASQLLAAGINSKKIIPIMTTLGNVTSGMGTGAEGVKRATVAIQQMNAAQAIHAQDLNQLRDAGIPVYDLLSKALGKSKKQVSGLVQAGKLGKPALDKMMAALTSGKGLERFNGLMQKQSQSLVGLWSTVKDTFGQGLAKAMAPALPMIKAGLGQVSNIAQAAFKRLPGLLDGVIGKVKAFGKSDTWASILSGFKSLGKIGGQAIGILGKGLPVVGGFIGFLVKHNDVFVPLVARVGALVAGIRIWQGVTKTMAIAQGLLNIVMTANPIGLIVVGIAALAAGLVVAYKKSETFRKIVNATWSGIKTGRWPFGSGSPARSCRSSPRRSRPRSGSWDHQHLGHGSGDVTVQSAWGWLSGPFAGFFSKTLPRLPTCGEGHHRAVVGGLVGHQVGVRGRRQGGQRLPTHSVEGDRCSDRHPGPGGDRPVQIAWARSAVGSRAWHWVSGTFRSAWAKSCGLSGPLRTVAGWIKCFWETEKRGWSNIAGG